MQGMLQKPDMHQATREQGIILNVLDTIHYVMIV